MNRAQMTPVLMVALLFVLNSWMTSAMPSYPLVIRNVRQAPDSAFGNISSDDASVNLMLEPSAPWEDFIMPSPVVISLLGQLMVISGKVDFSLAEYPPEGGFKYMNHPDSFAASLVQVTNEGWNAFKVAHENMDRIQLSMLKIPVQIRRSITIMSQGSTTMSQLLLPSTLQVIQDIGQSCVVWAKETDAKFGDVMFLIGELLEVSTVAKGKYQEKLEDVRVELNVTMQEKAMMDKIGDRLKKQTAEMDAEVAKARKQYEDALKKIPTGLKAFGMEILHGLLNVVTGALGGIPKLIIGGIEAMSHSSSNSHDGGSQQKAPVDIHTITTLASVKNLYDTVQKIRAKSLEMLQAKNNTHKNVEGMARIFKTAIDAYKNMFQQASCQITDQALGFVNQAESIINDFEKEMKRLKPPSKAEQSKIINGFNNVINAMKPLVAKSEAVGDGLSATKSTSSLDLSCSNEVGCNEKFVAQLQLNNLEDAENSRDKVFAQTMQYYEEMKSLVGKLAHLHLDEINFEQIVELLKKGIELLGKIRQQWSNLIQFFSMVSIRTEVLANQTLVQFLKFAEESEKIVEDGQGDSQLFFNLLERQATEINQIAYFLYTLSSTYYEVSSKYLLDRLAGLSQLLAAKDDQERQHSLEGLKKNVNETQEAIKELALEKRHNYDQLMAARKSELENIINKLGGPDANDAKIIQDASGGNQTFLS